MNTRSSSYTGRYPRSLSEAFGPYESGPIDDGTPRWSRTDWIVVISSAAAFVALAVLHFTGVLQ